MAMRDATLEELTAMLRLLEKVRKEQARKGAGRGR